MRALVSLAAIALAVAACEPQPTQSAGRTGPIIAAPGSYAFWIDCASEVMFAQALGETLNRSTGGQFRVPPRSTALDATEELLQAAMVARPGTSFETAANDAGALSVVKTDQFLTAIDLAPSTRTVQARLNQVDSRFSNCAAAAGIRI